MKTLRPTVLLLGALCSAAGLIAQANATTPVKTLHHDHDELGYVAKPVVREFTDKTTGGVVTVTWTYLGQEQQGTNVFDRYQCVISQTKNATSPKGYSLYNLQIQGRRWQTQVHVAGGTQVVFTAGTAAPITSGTWSDGRQYKGLPFVGKGAWNPNQPDSLGDDRVAFIKFTGTDCTLEVLSKRQRHSPFLAFQSGFVILSSHDATPPPPDGGGEN